MAAHRTLEQLREAVRVATDSKGTSALARHSDKEIDDAINRGRNAFFVIVSQCNGGDRTIAVSTIATTTNTSVYGLPIDMDRVVSVEFNDGDSVGWLDSFQHEDRAHLSTDYACGMRYRVQGTDIEILPKPRSTGELIVRYVPSPTNLTLPTSSFDTILRLGEEYTTYWAARIVKESEGAWDYVDRFSARLAEIEQKTITTVRMRIGAPARIVDASKSGLVRRW